MLTLGRQPSRHVHSRIYAHTYRACPSHITPIWQSMRQKRPMMRCVWCTCRRARSFPTGPRRGHLWVTCRLSPSAQETSTWPLGTTRGACSCTASRASRPQRIDVSGAPRGRARVRAQLVFFFFFFFFFCSLFHCIAWHLAMLQSPIYASVPVISSFFFVQAYCARFTQQPTCCGSQARRPSGPP